MPFWDRTLDLVVLTHPELDHITGLLPVLERYQVDTVVFRPGDASTAEYERWLALVEVEGAEVQSGEAGLELTLDEDVQMTVLHPGPKAPRRTCYPLKTYLPALRNFMGLRALFL